MYLIRLDDACPYMDRAKWHRMEDVLDKYGVKPLVGIIPANADPQTMIEGEDIDFWNRVHRWMDKGWSMALHGYDHVCVSEEGMNGINPMWRRSEFAGLPLEQQKKKIRKGLAILCDKGISSNYFFAPSHTFDENTLHALESESEIRIICDTIALKPYKKGNFVFIPQIVGHCVSFPLSGIFTFCFHPNTMHERDYEKLESFIEKNQSSFLSFEQIDFNRCKEIRLYDKVLSWLFFKYRSIKGLQ